MKNVEDDFHKFPPAVVNYIKSECLSTMGLGLSPIIRSTVGLLMAMITARGGLVNWPELLPKLCQMLDSPEESVRDDALSTLQEICGYFMVVLSEVHSFVLFFLHIITNLILKFFSFRASLIVVEIPTTQLHWRIMGLNS